MNCVSCKAEVKNVPPRPAGAPSWPLCGTCLHEPVARGDAVYPTLLKRQPAALPVAPMAATPRIGVEIETTIRVRARVKGDEKISSYTWDKHGPSALPEKESVLYKGRTWSLTVDHDPVTNFDHVEYVTEPMDIGSEAGRTHLIRGLSDIAALSRYYHAYMIHKQGDLGSRMNHQETWIAFGHAMRSTKQRAWLEQRFANSSVDLAAFRPGTYAYMVEGANRMSAYTWQRGRPDQLHVAMAVRGAPQVTVDIPIGQVFRLLEALSAGALNMSAPGEEPIPLFRQQAQVTALHDVVGQVRRLDVTEAQRGLLAMMGFYLKVAELQKTKVTFVKEAYPLLNRCGFSNWLALVKDEAFPARLKGHLQQVTGLRIDKTRMISERLCTIQTHQNPFRDAWVESVKEKPSSEMLKLNTKRGWWPIRNNQLLTFELRGLPGGQLVDQWCPMLVGIYDWFQEFLAQAGRGRVLAAASREEKLAPPFPAAPRMPDEGRALRPVQVVAPPAAQRPMPPLWYEMKKHDLLTQEMINEAQRMASANASPDEIERFLRRGAW